MPNAHRLALTTMAVLALFAGCKPLDPSSKMRETIMREPDPSFLKRVKNDPFPSAGQMAGSPTSASSRTAASTNSPSNSPSTSTTTASTTTTTGAAQRGVPSSNSATISIGENTAAGVPDALASDEAPTTVRTAASPNRGPQPLRRPATNSVRRN